MFKPALTFSSIVSFIRDPMLVSWCNYSPITTPLLSPSCCKIVITLQFAVTARVCQGVSQNGEQDRCNLVSEKIDWSHVDRLCRHSIAVKLTSMPCQSIHISSTDKLANLERWPSRHWRRQGQQLLVAQFLCQETLPMWQHWLQSWVHWTVLHQMSPQQCKSQKVCFWVAFEGSQNSLGHRRIPRMLFGRYTYSKR